MTPRSIPQNRKFSAMVGDVWKRRPLTPYRKTFAREVWKRYFIALYVDEARGEALAQGWPDPFPTGAAASSELNVQQMTELIESTYASAAMRLDLVLE